MESNYSLSDIRAATDGMDGQGSWFWIIVLFLFMFGANGGGVFGGQGLTRAEMTEGFNNQSVLNKLDGISNGLCDGFYAQNTTMLQGFNGVGNQIAESRFAAQQCCCETNRNIDNVRYEASKNTCDITTAIHAEGEATRALINANTMQALRDKLEDKDRELMTANFQLSQQAQSANLIAELRPCAKPAYITCSPYQARNFGGCGCDCYA
jgi:hypothetical protein